MNFRNLMMVGLVSALSLALMQGCGGGGTTDAGTGGGTGGGATGGGTGGGSTGGGTGGGTADAGTDAGAPACETIASIGPNIAQGNYYMYLRDGGVRDFQKWEGDVYIPHSDGGIDLMFVERWWETASGMVPTFPTLGVMIPGNNTIDSCFDCVYYLEGCNQQFSNCGKIYFATSGTLNYLTGDANPDAGVFSGNGAAIHLKEWDCANFLTGVGMCADTAVTNGACKDVAAYAWDGGWP